MSEETKKDSGNIPEPEDNQNKNPHNPSDNQGETTEKNQMEISETGLSDQSSGGSGQASVLIDEESSNRVETKVLEESMETSYLQYAMSVIVSRALPDVRDGMKPVHRRIVYTMYKLGLTPGSKYMKCARVVGEVIGKYHPHGDQAVYNALVRLSQDFAMRYPLVDGQGNFGSIDGDSPAAYRYTESRMDKPAPFMVADIEKETVDFIENFDGTEKEPKVLPTLFPNLLVNGQTGIAVGMATEIPPHNLAEVCRGILLQIKNPEVTPEELMEHIQGPDLPTGATIYGQAGILQAYKTGRGKCVVQAKADLTEDTIIVREIPYQINKADLLVKIADLVKNKRISGIKDIRDESNKEGIRIIIEIRKEASPEVVLNQLYQMSDLQTSMHFNMLALVNDGRQPKLLGLKEILQEFINHRFKVVTRRTEFELKKAQAELHILEGLKIALDNIDEVIKLIRSSYDKEEASKKLRNRFEFSDKQAEAILQMRLQTLTNLDKSKIEEQYNKLLELIKGLKEILEIPEKKKELVCQEIQDVSDKFKSPRRTKIVPTDVGDYNKEDFVEEEDVLVQLTKSQYIKVLPLSTFRQQGRGGRGVSSFNPKEQDWVKQSMVCNSHDYVFAFTSKGRVFKTRVFDLPGGSRIGRGQSIVNYLQLQEGEIVTNILTLTKEEEKEGHGSLIFATRKGLVKRTLLDQFKNIRKTGIIAVGLNEGDSLVDVVFSRKDTDNVIISASNGKTVIFNRERLSPLGRSARGVKGIRLKKDDYVISLIINDLEIAEGEEEENGENGDGSLIKSDKDKVYPSLLVVTSNGFGKHTYLGEYRKTNRAAGGVKTLNKTKKTGYPVFVEILYGEEDDLMITTKKGVTIKISLETISQLGRNTQGVKLIKLDKGDEVVSAGVN
jgi:DNA gyrase subunit A